MDTTQPTATDQYACASCGSSMHVSREECPWCGAPNPLAGEPTRTLNGAAADGSLSTSLGAPHSSPAVQTVTLLNMADMSTRTIEHEPASTESTEGTGRGRRFWVRTYGWVLLALLLAILGFGAAGVIQGLKDREVASTTDAIAAYERGRELVDQGQYDLAIAYFQEALRLEPEFPAAAQMMAFAEAQHVAQEEGTPIPPTVTSEPVDEFDAAAAFTDASQALSDEEWLAAADAFVTLQGQAPDFRPDEVQAGLFAAYEGLGRVALEEGDLEDALRYFEEALRIRPDSAEVARIRRLTASYRNAMEAFEEKEWSQAADLFRSVYVIDRTFLDVEANLYRAHIELAEAFEARDIWCDAAQNYRAALTIDEDNDIARKAAAAEQECSVVSVPDDDDLPPTPEITQDEVPIVQPTAVTPDDDEDDEEGFPTPTVPVIPTVSPLPSATVRPTSPPAPSNWFTPSAVNENLGEGCFGRYLLGTVYDRGGVPMPGVTLLLVDQFGNRVNAVSKDNPPGGYDFQINQGSPAYQVMVLSGDQVISNGVTVFQSETAINSQVACYTVNWRQQ